MELTFDPKEFVEKTKSILRTPVAFYKGIEKEKGWKPAFTYSIVLSVIASVMGLLEVTLLYPLFQNQLQGVFSPDDRPQFLELLPAFFLSAILVVLLGFVWSGALHLWFRVCRLKGTYWNAYKTFTYSRAPLSLFGWIPVVGGFFGLYSLYLLVVGISVHYKITKTKAFFVLVVPLIALFVIQGMLFAAATSIMP